MSPRNPSGKTPQGISTRDFTGGSTSRLDGHPAIVPTFPFQARAISRRNAGSAGFPHRDRYSMKRFTTASSTSSGEILLAEQKRMNDDNRYRTRSSWILALCCSHSAIRVRRRGCPSPGPAREARP